MTRRPAASGRRRPRPFTSRRARRTSAQDHGPIGAKVQRDAPRSFGSRLARIRSRPASYSQTESKCWQRTELGIGSQPGPGLVASSFQRASQSGSSGAFLSVGTKQQSRLKYSHSLMSISLQVPAHPMLRLSKAIQDLIHWHRAPAAAIFLGRIFID